MADPKVPDALEEARRLVFRGDSILTGPDGVRTWWAMEALADEVESLRAEPGSREDRAERTAMLDEMARLRAENADLRAQAGRLTAGVVADVAERQDAGRLRRGQQVWNALRAVMPDAVEPLRGGDADPFYDDARLPAFFAALGATKPRTILGGFLVDHKYTGWSEGRCDTPPMVPASIQPAPSGGTGDVWAELIATLPADHPMRPACVARREEGIRRYGQPLRRGDGRDEMRDLLEELLDAAVYAWRLGPAPLGQLSPQSTAHTLLQLAAGFSKRSRS